MKSIVIKVISLVFILGFVFVGYLFIGFNYGGITGFFLELKSLPTHNQLEVLRNSSRSEILDLFDNLTVTTDYTFYEETNADMCIKGTHSWKMVEPYAYICVYSVSRYYGFDNSRSYSNTITNIEEYLTTNNWKPSLENSVPQTYANTLKRYPLNEAIMRLPEYSIKKGNNVYVITTRGGFASNYKEPYPYKYSFLEDQIVSLNRSTSESLKPLSQTISSNRQYPLVISIERTYVYK